MLAILNNQAHNGNGGFKPFPVGWSLNVAEGSRAGDTQNARSRNGWIFVDNVAVDTITFSNGNIVFATNRETDSRKMMYLVRKTNKTITKDVAFWCGGHFKTGSCTVITNSLGLFNRAQLHDQVTNVNQVWSRHRSALHRINSTTVRVATTNSVASVHTYADVTTISDNTEYWWRQTGNGSGSIKWDVYSTFALWKAAGNGDVATTTTDVSSNDFSCDRFGIIDTNGLTAASETMTLYWFDGDVCDWYNI